MKEHMKCFWYLGWKRTPGAPWCLRERCPCWHRKQWPGLRSSHCHHSCHMISDGPLLGRNEPTPEKHTWKNGGFLALQKHRWSFWGAAFSTSFSACVVVMALAIALVLRPPLTSKELMPAFSLMYTSACFPLEKKVRSPDRRECF